MVVVEPIISVYHSVLSLTMLHMPEVLFHTSMEPNIKLMGTRVVYHQKLRTRMYRVLAVTQANLL